MTNLLPSVDAWVASAPRPGENPLRELRKLVERSIDYETDPDVWDPFERMIDDRDPGAIKCIREFFGAQAADIVEQRLAGGKN